MNDECLEAGESMFSISLSQDICIKENTDVKIIFNRQFIPSQHSFFNSKYEGKCRVNVNENPIDDTNSHKEARYSVQQYTCVC